ncbi:Hypothetical predicted protein [Octopus vulgaris]|uniref:Uncharacterized protein n=1 Tax=Octopus vulgaris TaxID=6645 RepID=A0AA36BRL7_OCTVU|nr:Hypothetical predicted protein [Octopus vulgaris]
MPTLELVQTRPQTRPRKRLNAGLREKEQKGALKPHGERPLTRKGDEKSGESRMRPEQWQEAELVGEIMLWRYMFHAQF